MFGVQLMMITITKQYKERKHLKEINMSKTQKKDGNIVRRLNVGRKNLD